MFTKNSLQTSCPHRGHIHTVLIRHHYSFTVNIYQFGTTALESMGFACVQSLKKLTCFAVGFYETLLELLNHVKKYLQFHLEAFEFMMILCPL